MRFLIWVVRIIIFLSILGFALNNTQDVPVYFIPDIPELNFIAPLIFWIFITFFLGVFTAIFFLLPTIFKSWKRSKENGN